MRTGATEAAEDGPLALAVEERKLLLVRGARRSVGRRQEIAQHERLHGLGLALERQRLELGRRERSTASRERARPTTQISSSPARAISRAASAAVSPSTVYVLRKLAPTCPVKTRPSLTPM